MLSQWGMGEFGLGTVPTWTYPQVTCDYRRHVLTVPYCPAGNLTELFHP
jgi:hypothetical protein